MSHRDSDPIITTNKKSPDDFTTVLMDLLSGARFKLYGLFLIIYLLIHSDIFVNNALVRFSGAVDGKCQTTYGVVLQGTFLVLCMMGIEALIAQKII